MPEQAAVTRRDFLNLMVSFGSGLAVKAALPGLEFAYRIMHPDQLCALDVCDNFTNTEIIDWIRVNTSMIVAQAQQYYVPPDLVMAIIYREHVGRRIYTGMPVIGGTDIHVEVPLSAEVMSAKQQLAQLVENDLDVSIGPAQVQVRTARRLEAMLIPEREIRVDSVLAQKRAVARLNTPLWNIAYSCLNTQVEMAKLGIKYSPNINSEDISAIAAEYNGSRSYGQDVAEYHPYFRAYYNEYIQGQRRESLHTRAHVGFQILVEDELEPEMTELLSSTRRINLFVIHHTVSEIATQPTIFLDHVAKGFGGIGYHGLIGNGVLTQDGKYYSTRNSSVDGAHAPPHNFDSVGIALIGNFNEHSPTEGQIQTVTHAWAAGQITYGLLHTAFVTHRHIDSTTECPGSQFPIDEIHRQSRDVIDGWKTKWSDMGISLPGFPAGEN